MWRAMVSRNIGTKSKSPRASVRNPGIIKRIALAVPRAFLRKPVAGLSSVFCTARRWAKVI